MMQPAPTNIPPPTMEQQHHHYQQQQGGGGGGGGGIMPPQQQQQQPWMMMPPQQQWNPQQVQQQVSIPPLQQQQLPPHQMIQQPQQVQQYSALPQPTSSDEIRTLWIGDLQYWMEETYLTSCFAHTNEVLTVKVIRNKQTGQSESYGFIEFVSRAAAERVLQSFNGTVMPNTEQNFRLNWATLGSGEKRADDGTDYTIFVGDLASDVSDYTLQETFKTHYPSVKGAKVVTDRITGRSKGYGFVKFADESEQVRAMTEMNGMFCSTRAMRIGPATNKKTVGTQQQYPKASFQSSDATQSENDPNNTTVVIPSLKHSSCWWPGVEGTEQELAPQGSLL
ncbi:hypothetical protein IFM89_020670 [Coptis chinensis]|uniref:RRM domain-containing protein n=1 Tax=Coptis chinensis TaxID=261450 RepID=A0A835GZY0_9MAGN|nr:hypothetical protein IFM89_020670 [Coptis chinensis]